MSAVRLIDECLPYRTSIRNKHNGTKRFISEYDERGYSCRKIGHLSLYKLSMRILNQYKNKHINLAISKFCYLAGTNCLSELYYCIKMPNEDHDTIWMKRFRINSDGIIVKRRLDWKWRYRRDFLYFID
jgi:hypothetical protein